MPSSSSSLNLSQDPSAIIEGDLALLVRQHLTPEEQKRLPVSRQKQLVEERRNNMVDIGELAEIGERSYIQKEKALEEMQSNNVDISQNEFSFAKRKVFNLKKFAQQDIPMLNEMSPEMPMETQPPQSQGLTQKFDDASDLRDYILQKAEQDGDITNVQKEIESLVPEENLEIVRGAFSRFIEANTPEETLELASVIFRILPEAVKTITDNNQGDTQVTAIEQRVAETNESIRLSAIQCAKNKATSPIKKSFNMKLFKTAQHKGLENVMMFGPDQVRVDPFTGQLISNWHVYERNKGWGIKMPDALDVDFETIWRTNIMDKYSRPYRNDEGEYVGGYLNKRFEVDRNVPAGNSYQLLPGQKRRAYLPEYRSTEARLQNMRSKPNDRDLEFANTDKPTDWAKEGTEFNTFNFKRDVTASKKKVV